MTKTRQKLDRKEAYFLKRIAWMVDRLAHAKTIARFYAGTPHNFETDCYDRGPAERFLESLKTDPKLESTDA